VTGRSFWRGAAFSVVGLAVFSALFSLAAKRGLWPQLAPGALHNTDLWAGLAAGVVLLLLLLRGGERRTGS